MDDFICNCQNELKEGIKADVMFNFYNFQTVVPVQKVKPTEQSGQQKQSDETFAQILAHEKQKVRKEKEPVQKTVLPFFVTPANFDYQA